MFSDVTAYGLVATWHYIQKRSQLSIIYSVYLLLLVCLLYSRWQHCCIATNSGTHSAVLSSVMKNTVCRNYSVIMDRNESLLIYPYDPWQILL